MSASVIAEVSCLSCRALTAGERRAKTPTRAKAYAAFILRGLRIALPCCLLPSENTALIRGKITLECKRRAHTTTGTGNTALKQHRCECLLYARIVTSGLGCIARLYSLEQLGQLSTLVGAAGPCGTPVDSAANQMTCLLVMTLPYWHEIIPQK